MKIFDLLVCALFVVFCILNTDGSKGEKTMKIDRCIACPEYKNLSLVIERVTFTRIGRSYATTMKFKLTQTTSSKLKIKLKLTRCKTRESLDSCENMPDMVFSTMCMVVKLRLPPFGSSINAIQPPLSCPMEKGSYAMINNTVDETTLSVLPLEGWYWKITCLLYDIIDGEEKMISCTYTECSIVYI